MTVDTETISAIGSGLCLLVGIAPDDTDAEIAAAVDKITGLRVFADADGRMNLSVADVEGEILVVSQFTLYGDIRRGRRPSFTGAAPAETAEPLIDALVEAFGERGLRTARGAFGERMAVDLVNDGPVTLVLDVSGGVVG